MLAKAFSIILTILTVQLLFSGAFSRSKRLKKSEKQGVYLPDFMLIIGIICSVFFAAFACFAAFADVGIWAVTIFSIFILLGLSLIIAWKNCCVMYDENGFIHKTFFGKKRNYTYDQVTGYKGGGVADITLYVSKKKIIIDKLAINGAAFLELVKQKSSQSGTTLEKKGGKIANATANIVVVSLLLAFTLVAGVGITWSSLTPVSENDAEHYEVVFEKCKTLDGDMYLYPEDDDMAVFIIDDYADYVRSASQIRNLCKDEEEFDVWANADTFENGEMYFQVRRLDCGDNTLFSFADATIQNIKASGSLILASWVFVLVLAIALILMSVAAKNPQNHKKMASFFFGKNSVDIAD